MHCIQYTIRDVPPTLNALLRKRAKEDFKSLNETLIRMLGLGVGYTAPPPRNEELLALAGSWVEDEAVDKALADQDTVDAELWK